MESAYLNTTVQAVCTRIDSSVQLISLRVELNDDFINHNVVQIRTVYRLYIGFLNSPMNDDLMAVDI